MENIKEALAAGKLLIADGATGTMLMARRTAFRQRPRAVECGAP